MRKTYLLSCLLLVPACLTNIPEPDIGGVYACVVQEDCPGSLSCLAKVCEAIELPSLMITNPEEEEPYPVGMDPEESINIRGTNFVLRPLAESNERVPGEGHLVIFLDGEEIGTIDAGDLTGGVSMPIAIPITDPGAHRIHVQARFNDGTNYDNEGAVARRLVWVDNGQKHVAIRSPWPGEKFPLEATALSAEVLLWDPSNTVDIGPPASELQHVHIYYDKDFPGCFDSSMCYNDYKGVVPSDMDEFGPLYLPTAAAGEANLVAAVMQYDHTIYLDDLGQTIYSPPISVLRTDQ